MHAHQTDSNASTGGRIQIKYECTMLISCNKIIMRFNQFSHIFDGECVWRKKTTRQFWLIKHAGDRWNHPIQTLHEKIVIVREILNGCQCDSAGTCFRDPLSVSAFLNIQNMSKWCMDGLYFVFAFYFCMCVPS